MKTTGRSAGLTIGVLAIVAATAVHGEAQMAEFLGPHVMETLPQEIPGTGRIGGVTVDGWGYLYVANQDERVWKIHPSGETELFVEGLYGSGSGTIMPNADLLHSAYAGDKIVRVGRDGTVVPFVSAGLEGPVGMARVGDHVYVVNAKSDWVAKISLKGDVREFVRDERLQVPNGITADPDGNLYVVSLRNTLVLKITPEGEISEVAELPGRANAHVAFAQGALYVTQIWDNVVLRVEMDGSYQVVAGDGTLRARPGTPYESRTPYPNGIMASRRGDVLYFNTLEGNMVSGDEGVIRVHKLYIPSPERAFQEAWREGGMDGLKRKFDTAMSLQEVPPTAMIQGLYQVGDYLLNRGDAEAGLALIEWTAEMDENEFAASLNLGRAHLVYGDAEIALANLEKAAELDPDDEQARRSLETAKAYRRSSS